MTQDVRQWLAEIKHLQHKLESAYKERDEALSSAANWRRLYETEAQQRRTETALSQQAIADLKDRIKAGQTPNLPLLTGDLPPAIAQQVASLETPESLQQALAQALVECDRLSQALRAEQSDHDQTRKSLTAALGETVDRLAKERAARNS
ncbi:MAG: hypothetical protein Fur0046_13660 [Cyanobacteria bacterium J069]|nr:MAG: hypothetical protein D6742_14960 [Cyanobacteria bacterium J069]